MISALGWGGKPFQCLELARAGQIQGVSCREILEELATILQNKLGFTPEEVADAVADLLEALRLVRITGTFHAVPADPKDDMVVECAVVAGADYIVSGDRRHLLPLKAYGTIRIVDPSTLLLEVAA